MKIRRRTYPSGYKGWQLDCGILNGKRERPMFKTKDEAEAERLKRQAELKWSGESAFVLTLEQRTQCAVAIEKLAEVGATLDDAVDFFLKHAKPPKGPIALELMLKAFLLFKLETDRSGRYVTQLKSSVGSFVAHHGPLKPAHEVAAGSVEGWLAANEWKKKTQENYLGDVRTFFAWGIDEKYVTINPCEKVQVKVKVRDDGEPEGPEDDEIEFLAVPECERLLRRAVEVKDPTPRRDARGRNQPIDLEKEDFRDCLAFIVIGFFCGLRPERELGLMDWVHVKLEAHVVVVTIGRAKSRERRPVDLPLNARAWLAECPFTQGKILPKNFKRKWKRLRQAVGLFAEWPHDGIRHTFCTMHYAVYRDEKLLQALMGHVSADMIHKHYRGLATPREGKAFFDLWPYAWGASCPWPRESDGKI